MAGNQARRTGSKAAETRVTHVTPVSSPQPRAPQDLLLGGRGFQDGRVPASNRRSYPAG